MSRFELPGFATFRAFEAAARHLSYSRAARELGLTHGAISRHVARLEEELGGVRLFVREGQRMLLTDAGQILVVDIREGLDLLSRAMQQSRAQPRRMVGLRSLAVSVHPAFAARWLLPRLGDFQTRYPQVEIAIHPSAGLSTLDGRDGIHLAIRYGPGNWPGLASTGLMKSYLAPVCSQRFLQENRIERAEDLLRVKLLRSPRQKWRPWFVAAGLDVAEPAQGTIYDDPGLLLQAAAGGEGVALARTALVREELDNGTLVMPVAVKVEDSYGWHVVWRNPPSCDAQDLDDLRQWLLSQAELLPR